MRDQAHIDFCGEMVEMYEHRIRDAREKHRLLGLGIANMEEFLAEHREKLRKAEAEGAIAQRSSRDGQQL